MNSSRRSMFPSSAGDGPVQDGGGCNVAYDDARPLPRRRRAACPAGNVLMVGGHRDLPRGHASDRPSGLGGAFNFRA